MVSPSPVPTLLLLDDDPGVLKVLSHLGGRAGFDVSTYEDPAGALDAVRQSAPDVAMVDLRLPRMGGLTVITDLPPVVLDQYAIQCSLILFAAEISSFVGCLPGIVMTTIAVLNFFCA